MEQRVDRLEKVVFGNGEPGIREVLIGLRGDTSSMLRRFDEFKDSAEKQIAAMWKKIDGRPSWPVAALLAFLSSACVGLMVGLLTR